MVFDAVVNIVSIYWRSNKRTDNTTAAWWPHQDLLSGCFFTGAKNEDEAGEKHVDQYLFDQ